MDRLYVLLELVLKSDIVEIPLLTIVYCRFPIPTYAFSSPENLINFVNKDTNLLYHMIENTREIVFSIVNLIEIINHFAWLSIFLIIMRQLKLIERWRGLINVTF